MTENDYNIGKVINMADDEEKDLDDIIQGWGDKKHKDVKSSLKHHDAETSEEKMLDIWLFFE